MYTDSDVVDLVTESFIPVRVHNRDQEDEFQRLGDLYGVQWTPTILVIDPDGEERHRIQGFLPVDDFLPQLALGRAHAAFARGEFAEAERRYEKVIEDYPDSEAAAEAAYWSGVSGYKRTGEPEALTLTAHRLVKEYGDSTWVKKASVWLP